MKPTAPAVASGVSATWALERVISWWWEGWMVPAGQPPMDADVAVAIAAGIGALVGLVVRWSGRRTGGLS